MSVLAPQAKIAQQAISQEDHVFSSVLLITMGFWDLFEISLTEHVVIAASCDTVWRLVSDLDHYPEIVGSLVESMERLDGTDASTDPLRVGTRLRRRLRVGGGAGGDPRILESTVTVTALGSEDGNYPKTLSTFADNYALRITGRISLTVMSSDDSTTIGSAACRLVACVTMLPKGCCVWLGSRRRSCLPICALRAVSRKLMRQMLRLFAEAAVERQQQQQGEPPNQDEER